MEASTLNELLECSVCFEVLDQTSKVLPCQHTFCRNCLEAIVSSKKELICPECRSMCKVPIKDLPSNILLVRLLESMKTGAAMSPSKALPTASTASTASPQPRTSHGCVGAPRPSEPCPPSTRKACANRPGRRSLRPTAKALYDYKPRADGDLKFRKGDRIHLEGRVDDEWLRGELNGDTGVFPANYVDIVVPLNDRSYTCRALFDFTVGSSTEDHCLFFKTVCTNTTIYDSVTMPRENALFLAPDHCHGDEIAVIRKVDSNWVEGELNGTIGMFPMNFVEFNEHSYKLLRIKPTLRPRTGVIRSPSSSAFHHSTPFTQSPVVHPHSCGTEVTGSAKRHSELASNRWSTDIGPSMGDGGSSLLYKALYNYKPQKPDELELKANDFYFVTEHCKDGWYKGYSQSLQHGVFPGNYAKLLSPTATVAPGDATASTTTTSSHTKLITNVTQAVSRSLLHAASQKSRLRCSSSSENASNSNSSVAATSTTAAITSPKLCHRLSDNGTHWYGTNLSFPLVPGSTSPSICQSKPDNKLKKKNLKSILINRLSCNMDSDKTTENIHPPLDKKYRCIASYPAQSANEITLSIGDLLNVTEKRSDGWMLGVHNRTGKTGYFPANFVHPTA